MHEPAEPPIALPPNPYASPGAMTAANVADAAGSARPRLWPSLVATALALVAVIAAQVAGVAAIVAWHFARGGTAQNLQAELLDLVTQPGLFIALGLVGQLIMGGVAGAGGWLSPQPLALRLGLVAPQLSPAKVAILIAGALVPFAVGLGLAYALAQAIAPDPSVEAMYDNMTPAMVLPFLLFISLAPGLCEELLFRGYLQRRLLARWHPAAAILVTSLIFALFHIAPHAVVFALVVGIWLGVIAWKTGSVWPGIVCHALINGLWNVWQLGVRFELWSGEPPPWLLVGLGLAGAAAFAASLWILASGRTHTANPQPR